MGATQVWNSVTADLRTKVTEHDWKCYIRDLRLIGEKDGEVVIATRTRYELQRVGADHRHAIQRSWKSHDIKKRRIRLACWESVRNDWHDLIRYPWLEEERASEQSVKAEAKNSSGSEDVEAEVRPSTDDISEDRQHQTFGTLVEGPSNESAVRLLRHVAGGGSMPARILFISGKQGTGKTHLLSACQHALLGSDRADKAVYITAEMFSAAFIEGAMARDTRALKSRVRGGHVLLVDDLQSITKRAATEEEFFNTIRAVKASGGTIVITADAGVNELVGLSAKLRNELRGATTAEVGMPNDVMRREIVRRHADLLQVDTASFNVTEEMIDHLCLRVRGPGRELVGVLCSLYADCSIGVAVPVAPTMEMLDAVIRRQLGDQKPPSVDMIKRAAGRVFGVSKADLVSATKVHSVVRPRQYSMYLARTMTTKSFPQIGKAFGGRDHATVIYAYRKIQRLITENPEVAEHVEQLRAAVYDVQAEG
ncbi:MAG: DnaA/Hda family protein [Pseudomonadota bacterium]